MDLFVNLVAKLSDWFSVASFVIALWVGLRVRSLRTAFQDLIRGQDLLDQLRDIASEISDGAADTVSNHDSILLLFVRAEATLESLKGRVAGYFVVWGRRGALKSDIDVLRSDLDQYQIGGNRTLDRTAVMKEYRKIQKVVQRVENLQRDRRLEQ
jgi:hypothetical protein